MGYTTDFDGAVAVVPALNEQEISFLRDFAGSRRMDRTEGPLYAQPGNDFGQTTTPGVRSGNNPPAGQPGLWCQWVPTEDGGELEWDGGEKFYNSAEWMKYLIENLLAPSARPYVDAHMDEDPRLAAFTCDHHVTGTIYAQGEEPDDRWALVVVDNAVAVMAAEFTYGPPQSV